jgi:16S rRNA (guanine966-N2)-methyltransferase
VSAAEVSKRGQCRIIGGKWRARQIKFDDAQGLRPTTDRIRETVFNWLQPYLANSRCLDCFAGSGVLGFEALSRGAETVAFIEQNVKTVKNLRLNAATLGASNASVYHADTLIWLRAVERERGLGRYLEMQFDLVFLDPPFHTGLLAESAAILGSSGCLAEDAIIYVEHAIDETVVLPENWHCLKNKRTGQVVYQLYECRASSTGLLEKRG